MRARTPRSGGEVTFVTSLVQESHRVFGTLAELVGFFEDFA
jgi:hypothetical protein